MRKYVRDTLKKYGMTDEDYVPFVKKCIDKDQKSVEHLKRDLDEIVKERHKHIDKLVKRIEIEKRIIFDLTGEMI